MKRCYKLINLDCANCANKLERSIGKIAGVKSVNIAFITTRMDIDIEDSVFDDVFAEVLAKIAKFEPDIVVKRS